MENELPPGAIPQDVADNVDIKASEGEYIVPAEVVRFLGVDKLEKLVQKAKEDLAKLEAGGRVGGDPAPASPSASAPEAQAGGTTPAFAEGGVVTEGGGTTLPQDQGFAGVKRYKNAAGQEVFIPFVNGQPLFPIQEGFTEAPSGEVEGPQDRVEQVRQSVGGVETSPRSDSAQNDAFVEANKRPDVSTWTPEEFVGYDERRGGVGDMAMRAITSAIPLGGLVGSIARNITDRRVSNYIDQMLETGQDLRGNPLSPEQTASLTQTREGVKNLLSSETGLSFSPLEKLGEVVGRVTDFASLRGNTQQPRSSVNNDAQRMLNSSSQVGDRVSPSRRDDQYSGLGSTMGLSDSRQGGNPSEREQANAQTGSGGLYSKGGLVSKRKK